MLMALRPHSIQKKLSGNVARNHFRARFVFVTVQLGHGRGAPRRLQSAGLSTFSGPLPAEAGVLRT